MSHEFIVSQFRILNFFQESSNVEISTYPNDMRLVLENANKKGLKNGALLKTIVHLDA